jgi:hypothetical protein
VTLQRKRTRALTFCHFLPERITRLGDLFGRDSVQVHTVAFGPAAEDYQTLKEIANVLPRGSFSKLGLSSRYIILILRSESTLYSDLVKVY